MDRDIDRKNFRERQRRIEKDRERQRETERDRERQRDRKFLWFHNKIITN